METNENLIEELKESVKHWTQVAEYANELKKISELKLERLKLTDQCVIHPVTVSDTLDIRPVD